MCSSNTEPQPAIKPTIKTKITEKEFVDEQREKFEDEIPCKSESEKDGSDLTDCIDKSNKVDNIPLDSDLSKEGRMDFIKEKDMPVLFIILDILKFFLIIFLAFEIFGRILFWLKTKGATRVYRLKNYDQIQIGGFGSFRYEKEVGYYCGVAVTLSRARDIEDYLLEFDNGILNKLFWKPFFGFFGICRNVWSENDNDYKKELIVKTGILEANAAPSILE